MIERRGLGTVQRPPADDDVDVQPDIAILELRGVVSEEVARQFSRQYDGLIREGFTNFVVDLERVEYLGSAGIRTLLNLAVRAARHGGTLRLCSLPPRIRMLLVEQHLDRVFEIRRSRHEALRDGRVHKQEFAAWLWNQMRQRRVLSVNRMAWELGLNVDRVSDWLMGFVQPTESEARVIARYLSLSPKQVLAHIA